MAEQEFDASYILWSAYLMKTSGLNLTSKLYWFCLNLDFRLWQTSRNTRGSTWESMNAFSRSLLSHKEQDTPRWVMVTTSCKVHGLVNHPNEPPLKQVTWNPLDQRLYQGSMMNPRWETNKWWTSRLSRGRWGLAPNQTQRRVWSQLHQDGHKQENQLRWCISLRTPTNLSPSLSPIWRKERLLLKCEPFVDLSERKVTTELSKQEGKIQGNLVTSYKSLKDGELATGANNFFEGMKKFESLLGQTKVVLISKLLNSS